MNAESRFRSVFAIFRPLLSPFFRWKFNYHYDVVARQEQPFLILCNHNVNVDPIFLGMATRQPLRFVASEHILRKGFGTWFLMRYPQPIIHVKGKSGLKSSMDIVRAIHRGESVALFPEGNRSFNGVTMEIPEVTGKLAKMTGGNLITYRIEGGYLTQPRWSLSLRRGHIQGKLVHIYTREELKSMSDTQVTAAIRKDLYENAFETQKHSHVAFRGKNLALGMESTLYACPKCRTIGSLSTNKDHIFCPCGFCAEYDLYGNFNGTDLTIATWDVWQKELLREKYTQISLEDDLFSDEVTIQEIGEGHAVIKESNHLLRARKAGCLLDEQFVPFSDLVGVAVHSRNVLTVHYGKDETQYEVTGNSSFCALKYLDLYQLQKS